jgi:cobalamin biosynthesis Mg chelatase CobN
MSKTPRTDANVFQFRDQVPAFDGEVVDAELARQVERELADSRAETESWKILNARALGAICRAHRTNEARDKVEARVKETEEALRRLTNEVERGRLDCQCGDTNCQHVSTTNELLEAICDCVRALRGEGK